MTHLHEGGNPNYTVGADVESNADDIIPVDEQGSTRLNEIPKQEEDQELEQPRQHAV